MVAVAIIGGEVRDGVAATATMALCAAFTGWLLAVEAQHHPHGAAAALDLLLALDEAMGEAFGIDHDIGAWPIGLPNPPVDFVVGDIRKKPDDLRLTRRLRIDGIAE